MRWFSGWKVPRKPDEEKIWAQAWVARAIIVVAILWSGGQMLLGWMFRWPWVVPAFFLGVILCLVWLLFAFPRRIRRILDESQNEPH